MNIEFPYLIVTGLLLLVAAFYLSPYELSVKEDDDDE
jgi:hypothetical protein